MRRVVTGHDASGKSVFVSEGEPPHGVALRGVPRFRIDEVWSVVGVLRSAGERRADHPTTSVLSGARGHRIRRWCHVSPESDVTRAAESGTDIPAARRVYDSFPGLAGTMEPDAPGTHTSQTVDYGVVIRGEVWLSSTTAPNACSSPAIA